VWNFQTLDAACIHHGIMAEMTITARSSLALLRIAQQSDEVAVHTICHDETCRNYWYGSLVTRIILRFLEVAAWWSNLPAARLSSSGAQHLFCFGDQRVSSRLSGEIPDGQMNAIFFAVRPIKHAVH
jgi:hypothetical protein